MRVQELISLQGRVALITGGAGHLGGAMAHALAEVGADIIVLDVDRERASKVAKKVKDLYGVNAWSEIVDLADEKALRSCIKRLERLDILINSAALVGTSDLSGWAVPFEQQSVATWKKALDINVTAAFILAQESKNLLVASGHGCIINISSIYGQVGPDMRLYVGTGISSPAAYATSKGGINQLTRWLATVMAPDVRVNTISMGGVLRGHTEPFFSRYCGRTPLGRMAKEDDIKGAAVYLASDLSAYVTGQNIFVDGGWTSW